MGSPVKKNDNSNLDYFNYYDLNDTWLEPYKHYSLTRFAYFDRQDYAVFVFFILFLGTVTLYATFVHKQGLTGFFLGNRNLNFFSMACALFMATLGSADLVGLASSAAVHGVTAYAFELNATTVVLLLGWVFLPVYIASGSLTTVDYLKKRYGTQRMEISMACFALFILVSTKSAVELDAFNTIITGFFPNDSSYLFAVVPAVIFSSIMVLLGGIQAIALASVPMCGMYIMTGITLAFYSWQKVENYQDLKTKYFEAWPNTTRRHFGANTTYRYTHCGIPSSFAWSIVHEYNSPELPWPGVIFGITIVNIWYWCCDQMVVQIGLGGKNIRHVKYACIITGYLNTLNFIFLMIPGLIARLLYTETVACADPKICKHVCGEPTGCSQKAFSFLILDLIPRGMRGFVLSGIGGTCISSFATAINSGATIFTVNLYRNIKSSATEMELLITSKIAVVALAGLSLAWSPVVRLAPVIYDYMQTITSSLGPPIVAVFIGGLFSDRCTEQNAFFVLMMGMVIGLTRLVWEFMYPGVPCGQDKTAVIPDIISNFHYLHFSVFLFVLCMAFLVLSGIFSDPIPSIHLYRLLYWFRHSKRDRVDIADVTGAKKKARRSLVEGKPLLLNDEEIGEGFQTKEAITLAHYICCIDVDVSSNVVTNNEIIEKGKERANISEPYRHRQSLNLHAIVLLIVCAFIWGYMA